MLLRHPTTYCTPRSIHSPYTLPRSAPVRFVPLLPARCEIRRMSGSVGQGVRAGAEMRPAQQGTSPTPRATSFHVTTQKVLKFHEESGKQMAWVELLYAAPRALAPGMSARHASLLLKILLATSICSCQLDHVGVAGWDEVVCAGVGDDVTLRLTLSMLYCSSVYLEDVSTARGTRRAS